MIEKKYYPQHLHIHSIYEPGASMEGHMYFATLQGMKHIWFTEHDILWNKKPFRFGFEKSEANPDESGVPTSVFLPTADSFGEVRLDYENPYEGESSIRLASDNNDSDSWRGASAMTDGKYICQCLCRLPTLSFAYRGKKDSDEDVRFIFDICLSERPTDMRYAHIIFVSGNPEGLDGPHTVVIPMSVTEEWQSVTFDVAKIASSEVAMLSSVGGLDNAMSYLTVKVETRRGASASLNIDSLAVEGRATDIETKARQTEVALEIGKKYGVVPFVTAEISAGKHKNCFSTEPPVFKYGDPENKVTNEESCRVMCERGQVFSINHPFVHLGKSDPKTTDYDAECDAVIENIAENNADGASLLEVGFPFGRYAPYETHARLWDRLALRGIILTGHGATDSHMLTEGWFSGNNFASYVGVDAAIEPTESDMSAAMRSGDLYAANPLAIKSEFSFSADGKREMGSINILPAGTKSKISLSLGVTNHNWKVVWVVNGERVRSERATRMGYKGEYELVTSGKIDFVRCELYDFFGTLLLMTNPIYYTTDIKNIKNGALGRPVHNN